MKKIIYDVRKDKYLQKIIDERSQYFSDKFYVDTYGRYGTPEWWDNLDKKGLLVAKSVKVDNIKSDGKTTIALLKLKSNDEIFEVVMKGEVGQYSAGDKLLVTMVKESDIFTEKTEGWQLLKVENNNLCLTEKAKI